MTKDTNITLTPDAEPVQQTGASTVKLWDPDFTYGDITLNRRNLPITGVNVHSLVNQFFADDTKIRRITVPVTVKSLRKSVDNDVQVVATEMRVVSKRYRLPLPGGCNTVTMVGNRRGDRPSAESVLGSYLFANDLEGMRGRNVFARIAIRQNDTLQFAVQKAPTRSFHLVYRVDRIVPVPSDNPKLVMENGVRVDGVVVGLNLSLVAVYDLNALTGASRYVMPRFENQDGNPEQNLQSLRGFVDYAALILRKRQTPGYYSNLLRMAHTDTRHDYFGDGNDVTQTIPVEPKQLLQRAREIAMSVYKARSEARGESDPPIPRHVACGLEQVAGEAGTISTNLTFPSVNGVRTTLTTSITDIPPEWFAEPTLVRKSATAADLVGKLKTPRVNCLYGL